MKTKLLQLGFIFSLFFVGSGIAWSASPTCQTFYGGSTLGLSNVSSNLIQLNVFSNFGAGTKASVGSGASTVTGGTFKNLRLSSEGIAPGSTASWNAMLIVGQNASTSLNCTISGASATTCTDTTDTVATSSPGSGVFFLITPSGAPGGAADYLTASVDFCPNTYNLFSLPYGGSYSAITFSYGSLMAKGNPAATLGVAQQSVVPESGYLTQLWGKIATAGTGANPIVFTIMDNGASTTLATTSASTLPNPIADATTTISVNAGDLLNMSVWNPSASGAQTGTQYAVGWIPSIPGDFFESAGGVSPTVLRETYQTPMGSGGNTIVEASTSVPTTNMLIRTTTVTLSAAPGTGHSWTYGWRDNGATTTSSCIIANTATSCTMPPVTISDNGPIDIFVLPSTSAPAGATPSIGWIGNEQPGLFQPSQVNLTGGSLALSHGHLAIYTVSVPVATIPVTIDEWGGGGGGSSGSDGNLAGGTGAYVHIASVNTVAQSYTVIVGAGGAGANGITGGAGGTGYASGGTGANGLVTTTGGGGGGGSSAVEFSTIYVASAGGGASAATVSNSASGSSGGAGVNGTGAHGGSGGGASATTGGNGSGVTGGAAGTGGTAQTGTNGTSAEGGASAAGSSGNGVSASGNTSGAGSGGAAGGAQSTSAGGAGTAGSATDSGGGGGAGTSGNATGGNGGQPAAGGGGGLGTGLAGAGGAGRIIITIPTASFGSGSCGTNGVKTTSGSNTICTYSTVGTDTFTP